MCGTRCWALPRALGVAPQMKAPLPVLTHSSPARSGLLPVWVSSSPSCTTPPHAGEVVPPSASPSKRSNRCSPRRRGCSVTVDPLGRYADVLPAQAGLFRSWLPAGRPAGSPPRAIGVAPAAHEARRAAKTSSPRARGCSAADHQESEPGQLLPTSSGLLRRNGERSSPSSPPPRMPGVAPLKSEIEEAGFSSSPHDRSCSDIRTRQVRPDPLGVAPIHRISASVVGRSSPPARGCSGVGYSGALSPASSGALHRSSTPCELAQLPNTRSGLLRITRISRSLRWSHPRVIGVAPSTWWATTSRTPSSPRALGIAPSCLALVAMWLDSSSRARGCSGAGHRQGRWRLLLPTRPGCSGAGPTTVPPPGLLPARLGLLRTWCSAV
ncbi:hypothetical protein QBC98_003377 [Kitasatospora acidiphila]